MKKLGVLCVLAVKKLLSEAQIGGHSWQKKTRPKFEIHPASAGHFVPGSALGYNRAGRSWTPEVTCKYVKPRFKTAQVWRGSRWIAIKLLMQWVLGENPSRSFYERLGGRLIGEQEKRLGEDVSAVEVAFGWPAVESFVARDD